MKTTISIILTVMLTLTITVASCTPRASKNSKPVVTKLLYKEQLRTFSVPGFLVRYVMLISEDTRKMRPALKGISTFTISLSEDIRDSHMVFGRINQGLGKGNYINLMEIIDSKSSIVIKTLEHKDQIREIVVLINDSNSIICIAMKGRISPENLLKVVRNFA